MLTRRSASKIVAFSVFNFVSAGIDFFSANAFLAMAILLLISLSPLQSDVTRPPRYSNGLFQFHSIEIDIALRCFGLFAKHRDVCFLLVHSQASFFAFCLK